MANGPAEPPRTVSNRPAEVLAQVGPSRRLMAPKVTPGEPAEKFKLHQNGIPPQAQNIGKNEAVLKRGQVGL